MLLVHSPSGTLEADDKSKAEKSKEICSGQMSAATLWGPGVDLVKTADQIGRCM